MNNLTYKIGAGIATCALLASAFAASAFADTSIKVAGNGSFTHNDVDVTTNNTSSVTQSNFSDVNTHVHSSASTGGNDSSFNTGASTFISTGDASSDVTVGVSGPFNVANVPACGCNDPVHVGVFKNGSFSNTDVDVNTTHNSSVDQFNWQDVFTSVHSKSKTGHNNSNFNTGGGDGTVTGDAMSSVNVQVHAPNNTVL